MVGYTRRRLGRHYKANLIESLQKQAEEESFFKRVTGGLFDYYGIVPKKIRRSNLQ